MKRDLLKIYSAYLPYELKGKRTDGAKGDYILRAIYDDGSMIWKYDGFGNSKQIGVLPILYSMDMLTKEIEHKGERFIPVEKIKELYPNTPEFENYVNEWIKYYDLMSSKVEYVCVIKLIEWHFNVFGLDESEFIKKETL